MNALTISSSLIRLNEGLYSLNDLHKAAGNEAKQQPALFMRNDQTKALIEEILSSTEMQSIATKTILGKGKQQGTYVCKELVYAYAMWISPKFNLIVIRAFDTLHNTQPTLPSLITSIQAGELATLIAERFPDGRSRPYAWSRFNNHFRLSSYKTLPTSKFDEACDYIRTMPDKEKSLDLSNAFLPADGKYLVNIENGRAAYSKRVPDDTCLMNQEQMLKAINDPNGLYVSTEKLAEFAVATISRMAQRCAYYEAKNKQASPSKAISH